MISYLNKIGCQNIINRNVDFYAEINNNNIPGKYTYLYYILLLCEFM